MMLELTDFNPTDKLLSVSASPEYSLKLLSYLTAPKKLGTVAIILIHSLLPLNPMQRNCPIKYPILYYI